MAYIASNGCVYGRKETPYEYALRHACNAIRHNGPYVARDGHVYTRKETKPEYWLRKLLGRGFSNSPRRIV